MNTDQTPLPQRVASCYSQLKAAAKELNSISDELGKPIAQIDAALKKLNLGVAVWVPIRRDEGAPQESWFWSEDIGYCKIGGNWGISLRKISGDRDCPDQETEESWFFSDAPRTLRISAIEKIPDLLEKLSKEAIKTTEQIRVRLSEAHAVAEAVNGATNLARVPLRIPNPHPEKPETTLPPLPGAPSAEPVRDAVVSALTSAGYSSAANLLGSIEWQVDEAKIGVVVPGMSKKMLALVISPAVWTVIRQALDRLGASQSFNVSGTAAATSAREPASSSAPEVGND